VRPFVAAIVGPTAVGKSRTAVSVARTLGAEIVSVDSMQIYRGMDIGTDKIELAAREDVAHHLLDVFPPARAVTVAEYQALARAEIERILARGRLPLLVGGSGLSFRAVVDELEWRPHSARVRDVLEAEARTPEGPSLLHARLRELDPEAARRIARSNTRRVVRALEVLELTGGRGGRPERWRRYESIYRLAVAGITLDRPLLLERIEARTGRMLAAGLVDEVRKLEREGLGATARQALGYRQVLAAPSAPVEELERTIVRATKPFARRQESWFRADPRVVWFDGSQADLSERLAAFLEARRQDEASVRGSVGGWEERREDPRRP
jgi:tRNA dimethylallyltransferase